MTSSQFKKSIQTGELNISFWDSLTHYMAIYFIVIIPISFLGIRIKDNEKILFDVDTVTTIAIPTAFAIIFYLWQKHKLKFVQIRSSISHDKLKELLESISEEQNWHIEQSTKNIFIAKSQPGFNWRSWGEQITVLHDKGTIYINSICDPEKKSTFSSGGMNKRNTELLISRLLPASS